MRRISLKLVVLVPLCGLLCSERPSQCLGQQGPVIGKTRSVTESIASSVKQGFGKVSGAVTPKVPERTLPDAVSLSSEAHPSAKLYFSVARMYEQRGRLKEAAQQYDKALRLKPNHLGAMLGCARVMDRLNRPENAAALYARAAKAYPREASVFNNMGAFFGRRGKMSEAIAAMNRAVGLQPKQAKYRNNMAVLLVEMGLNDQALTHLRAVSSDAIANYNLGFLLSKKGQTQTAVHHFAVALQADPSMVQARQMLQRTALARKPQTPTLPRRTETRIGTRPVRPVLPPSQAPPPRNVTPGPVHRIAPPPRNVLPNIRNPRTLPAQQRPGQQRPGVSVPTRLPPVARRSASRGETAPLPSGPFRQRPTTPGIAPMPPSTAAGPAIQTAPRGY